MINIGTKEITQIQKGVKEFQLVSKGDKEIWGGSKIVDLGTAQSFNIAQILQNKGLLNKIKLNELTIDNFFYITANGISASVRLGDDYWAPTGFWGWGGGVDKSYSNNTLTFRSHAQANDRTMGTTSDRYSNVHAYLITRPDKLIHLGSAKTFDVSNISGFENFTIDNFVVKTSPFIYRFGGSYVAGGTASGSFSFSKTYNKQTGILTITSSAPPELTFDVYLVKKLKLL
ncbi:MAG: hypothetical protein KBT03_11480 [Bacteroidales bacterium]|nr:hypothetical protein [Candidatus Scybalousia scybalohippi]